MSPQEQHNYMFSDKLCQLSDKSCQLKNKITVFNALKWNMRKAKESAKYSNISLKTLYQKFGHSFNDKKMEGGGDNLFVNVLSLPLKILEGHESFQLLPNIGARAHYAAYHLQDIERVSIRCDFFHKKIILI